jgi:hypothetical protein
MNDVVEGTHSLVEDTHHQVTNNMSSVGVVKDEDDESVRADD